MATRRKRVTARSGRSTVRRRARVTKSTRRKTAKRTVEKSAARKRLAKAKRRDIGTKKVARKRVRAIKPATAGMTEGLSESAMEVREPNAAVGPSEEE